MLSALVTFGIGVIRAAARKCIATTDMASRRSSSPKSLNQLEKAYGPANSILDNCHIRFTYAANDDKTAKRISDLLGQATEKKRHRSYSGSGLFLTSRSESEQEYARPLLTPAEVNQLSQDDGILLVGGLLPYRARKVRYFLDPRFRGRDGIPPPDEPAQQARELPIRVASDWDGLVGAPLEDDPPASSTTGTADEPIVVDAAAATPEPTSGVIDSVWDGFFAKQGPPAAVGEEADSGDAAAKKAEELPL
jgi:hypothetical protein